MTAAIRPGLIGLAALLVALLIDPTRQVLATDRPSSPADAVDANIVTAIDVSDSVGRHEEWLQQAGIARALIDPAVMQAIMSGPHRQIGFTVFTWSSGDRFEILVPWKIISSPSEAAQVSAALASVRLIDRSDYGGGDHDDGRNALAPDRHTDISGAIDFGSVLLSSAPHVANRSVMNILTNGADNVAGGPEAARDRVVAAGVTINGIVLDQNPGLVDYLRASVIGGAGSFVAEISDPANAGKMFAEKFKRDLLVFRSTAVAPRQQ